MGWNWVRNRYDLWPFHTKNVVPWLDFAQQQDYSALTASSSCLRSRISRQTGIFRCAVQGLLQHKEAGITKDWRCSGRPRKFSAADEMHHVGFPWQLENVQWHHQLMLGRKSVGSTVGYTGVQSREVWSEGVFVRDLQLIKWSLWHRNKDELLTAAQKQKVLGCRKVAAGMLWTDELRFKEFGCNRS